MICDYCTGPLTLCHLGHKDYPHAFYYGPLWVCVPCQAWAGCHPRTTTPLGRVANAELRQWKMKAHAVFDPLWREKKMSRSAAYKWLASQMGLPVNHTHIGYMNVEQCKRVVEVCKGASL